MYCDHNILEEYPTAAEMTHPAAMLRLLRLEFVDLPTVSPV